MAERTALIGPLTTQVLEGALGWLAGHRDQPQLRLSVNISAASLSDPGLPTRWSKRPDGDLPPDRLIPRDDGGERAGRSAAVAPADPPAHPGSHLAVDDFGIGSCLAQLARPPFSELKIDTALSARCCDRGRARSSRRSPPWASLTCSSPRRRRGSGDDAVPARHALRPSPGLHRPADGGADVGLIADRRRSAA
jgi:EAL domain-containing protein (putative c-di-GMP-specific phosphodiesterase class I)